MHSTVLLAAILAFSAQSQGAMDPSNPVTIPVDCWQPHGPAATPVPGRVEARADGVVECVVPAAWGQLGTLRLHVSADHAVAVEVIAAEADRRAAFWRRVDIKAGEQDLVLPLRWFRWRNGRVPSWGAVDRLAIQFRGSASVVLSDGYVEPGSPFLGATDLEEVAGHPLRRTESEDVLLLTDAPDLDTAALLVRLDAVAAAIKTDLPFLSPPACPVPLVVLANGDAYRKFAVDLARAYNAKTGPPASTGYTLQGIALAAWDPTWGFLRPTYTHEYVHAWLSASAGLPSDRGDWFHEGMAARMQLRFHPQDDFAATVRSGLANPSRRLPLASLIDGHRLPLERYWQAVTVVDYLFETRPEVVPALLQALRDAGSADLRPHLAPVLDTDLGTFEQEWLAEATISGKRITFPDRKLHTEHYDLEGTYKGIYADLVAAIEDLRLAPYALVEYEKDADPLDRGRGQALIGIFKTRFLKRLESSVEAFRLSVRRAIRFQEVFHDQLQADRVVDSRKFHTLMRLLAQDADDEGGSLLDMPSEDLQEMVDESLRVQQFLTSLPTVDPKLFDRQRLHRDVEHDLAALRRIEERIRPIGPDQDRKLAHLKELLSGSLKGKKTLVFSYYKDTVRYVYSQLADKNHTGIAEGLEGVRIRFADGSLDRKTRLRLVQEFAPVANHQDSLVGSEHEVLILLSTDALSEGQNLQDCPNVINYDLHWNPMRMVQRAGRVDRIGTDFDSLHIHNLFPDTGLDKLLGLVSKLLDRLSQVDSAGLLDASVLGEEVHPRVFNALQRIESEDRTVLDDEERLMELSSPDELMEELRRQMLADQGAAVARLPDGIHSVMKREGDRGVFFAFRGPKDKLGENRRIWTLVDLETGEVEDNRLAIARRIACPPDEPTAATLLTPFDAYRKAIAHIFRSEVDQQARVQAPARVDPYQMDLLNLLRSAFRHGLGDQQRLSAALEFLNEPLHLTGIRKLRKTLGTQRPSRDLATAHGIAKALDAVEALSRTLGFKADTEEAVCDGRDETPTLREEDLELVCWEIIER